MSSTGQHKEKAWLGIIGGTGIYDPGLFRETKDLKISTPYGPPSSLVSVGDYDGKKIAFIPRHGRDHTIPPHKINYRANIYALKHLGVERIISISSVGSLREHLKPKEFVIPDQFIDRTKNRQDTFYEGTQVVHISSADPFCPELRKVLLGSAARCDVKAHDSATYVCIEGPRFSTRAESKLFRQWGADVVGMTLYPECTLAREAELCYSSLSMVTDYDVWAENPVSAADVAGTMRQNVENAKRLILDAVKSVPNERGCSCAHALKDAIL